MLFDVSSRTPMRSGVRLAAEKANLLRPAVFENGKITFIEVGDEIVVMVHHGHDQMDEARGGNERRYLWGRRLRSLPLLRTYSPCGRRGRGSGRSLLAARESGREHKHGER